MEDFSKIIERSEALVKVAKSHSLKEEFPQAFLFMDQAVHGYSKALYYARDDDEELYAALEQSAMRYGRLREEYRSLAFRILESVDGCDEDASLGNSKDVSQVTVEDGKFLKQLSQWKSGEGFDNIVGLAALKDILYNCVVMLPTSPYAEKFLQAGSDRFDQHVLLFGAPGNGKTEIVRAYHEEAKGTHLLVITPADVLSKYIGESERNLKILFDCAQKNAPSIIFFDEIDGLFSTIKRDGNTVSLLNQFLQLMQQTNGVQVIGATNFPWELPDATLRRFDHIVYVPMPNKGERFRLLSKYIGAQGSHISKEQLMSVAVRTKGFSCSDLKRAACAATRMPKTNIMKATHFLKIEGQNKWVPCTEHATGAVRMKFTEIPPGELSFRKLEISDLHAAIASNPKTTKSLDEDGTDMKKILDFSARMGSDGRAGILAKQHAKPSVKFMVCEHWPIQKPVYVTPNPYGTQGTANTSAGIRPRGQANPATTVASLRSPNAAAKDPQVPEGKKKANTWSTVLMRLHIGKK